MANFNGIQLTIGGKRLLAESIATGKPLIIDEIALGDGTLPKDAVCENMTALISHRNAAAIISRLFRDDGTVSISARLTSEQIPEGFWIRELGVIAHLQGGEPKLYAYDNTGDEADFLPVGGGSTYVEQIFRISTVIGNATNVIIKLDASIELDAQLRYFVDKYITKEGQQSFVPEVTNISGALSVIVDGAETFDWWLSDEAVWLEQPLPAGSSVCIKEVRSEASSSLMSVKLRQNVDRYKTVENQRDFTLNSTDPQGALSVMIEGVETLDWSIVDGKVQLSEPLPAGRSVWIKQIKAEIIQKG